MTEPPHGAAYLAFDGSTVHAARAPGRCFIIDARCLLGPPVKRAYAQICASVDELAAIRFDEPEIQQARRDALAWWIPMLGDNLVAITTLAVDGSRCAGSITITRRPAPAKADPFARLFPPTVIQTDLFGFVKPPPGPVIERYGGAPWPGGSF